MELVEHGFEGVDFLIGPGGGEVAEAVVDGGGFVSDAAIDAGGGDGGTCDEPLFGGGLGFEVVSPGLDSDLDEVGFGAFGLDDGCACEAVFEGVS